MNPTDDTSDRTRRAFLGTTATLSLAALAGCAGSDDGSGDAETESMQTEEMEQTEAMETETETEAAMSPADDVPVLNYALTLGHLENAFYREGLETFSDDELMDADVLSSFGDEGRMMVPDHLAAVGEHEAAHVAAISDTVESLNGTPVGEGEYDFGYETPSEFLAVAKALENTGVAAYNGAAPTVSNDDVFSAAIAIHSVEARHAAFLNELNEDSPFPAGVDEPQTMAEVTEIAGQFIVEN